MARIIEQKMDYKTKILVRMEVGRPGHPGTWGWMNWRSLNEDRPSPLSKVDISPCLGLDLDSPRPGPFGPT